MKPKRKRPAPAGPAPAAQCEAVSTGTGRRCFWSAEPGSALCSIHQARADGTQ